jgi:prepilin-type N-terminal cleavage/methylation domain-containing protein
MNMILKKRLASRRGRKGFTLVEVIVVLVILAILAAIAIPALTGYIDKAEDKKYIAQAHNIYVASTTIFDEAYADGELSSSPAALQKGFDLYTQSEFFRVTNIIPDLISRAAILIGEKYTFYTTPRRLGSWDFALVGRKGATIFETDGFWCAMYNGGNERVYVTYRMKRIEGTWTDYSDFTTLMRANPYDEKAGYEVYHVNV